MPNSGPVVQRNSTLLSPISSAILTPLPYPQLAAPMKSCEGSKSHRMHEQNSFFQIQQTSRPHKLLLSSKVTPDSVCQSHFEIVLVPFCPTPRSLVYRHARLDIHAARWPCHQQTAFHQPERMFSSFPHPLVSPMSGPVYKIDAPITFLVSTQRVPILYIFQKNIKFHGLSLKIYHDLPVYSPNITQQIT